MAEPREARLYEPGYDRAVDVAPGITMLHYPDGWAIGHVCPGVYRYPGWLDRYMIAPSCRKHDVVSEDPLTITPSILCRGSALPCGLHGYVTGGVWVDAGTPPETMAHIRGEVPDGP